MLNYCRSAALLIALLLPAAAPHTRMPGQSLTIAAAAVLPQVTHGAVFLNTRLQARARAAAAVEAHATSAPAMARASADPAPLPVVAPAKANASSVNKGKGKGKANKSDPSIKGKGKGKGKASASSKSRNSCKSKRDSKKQPMQQASTAASSFDAFTALVEAETAALRCEAARENALLAEYQNMSDIASQLHAMAMPALDQRTMTCMLCTAASGPPQDVISWLAVDQHPAASSCDDSEFLAMCTAFGLLDCKVEAGLHAGS